MNQSRAEKMGRSPLPKNGNFTLQRSALERAVQAWAVGAKARRGKGPYPSRRVADVAHDLTHPFRVVSKVAEDCVNADVDPMHLRELPGLVSQYVDGLLIVSYGWVAPECSTDLERDRSAGNPETLAKILAGLRAA